MEQLHFYILYDNAGVYLSITHNCLYAKLYDLYYIYVFCRFVQPGDTLFNANLTVESSGGKDYVDVMAYFEYIKNWVNTTDFKNFPDNDHIAVFTA